MALTVEFYGIARSRAHTDRVVLEPQATLGDAIGELRARYPEFSRDCTNGERALTGGFLANLDGLRFVSHPDTPLNPTATLLIMNADAGG